MRSVSSITGLRAFPNFLAQKWASFFKRKLVGAAGEERGRGGNWVGVNILCYTAVVMLYPFKWA